MKPRKILFVCPYPANVAPSQRLKFEQYYPCFREAGYEIHTSSFINETLWKVIYKKGYLLKKVFYSLLAYLKRAFELLTLSKYDVVYIHLWVTPFGPPFFEWLYRKAAKKIIYDIDDLVYLGNVKNKAHPFIAIIKGTKKPIYLMKNADHVITCTPYLDTFVRNYNQHTIDISSTINTELYQPKSDYTVSDKFTIGWSGSHSTSKYLHLLDEVFVELAKKHSFRLLVMGDADFSLSGVDVEALPWKEEYEVEIIKRFDVGVYPLPDEEWVLGKSGLKALQYMAVGVPTVATAIGTIFRIIQNGSNGFLANKKQEWTQILEMLIQNQQLRERIGKAAIDTVEKNYSIHSTQSVYLSILNELSA